MSRVRTPGQNGVREHAFQSVTYERLHREQTDDALDPARGADAYRVDFNSIRPHQTLAGNRPSRESPRPGPPDHPQLSRARHPAHHLTRDSGLTLPPPQI